MGTKTQTLKCDFCGGAGEIRVLHEFPHGQCCAECFPVNDAGACFDDMPLATRLFPDDWDGYAPDDSYDDAEAFASAGMGTDEDYGYFGEEY